MQGYRMPEVGVRLPRVVAGIVAGPADEELERFAVIEGSAVRDDRVNYKLFTVQQAEDLGTGRCSKVRC